MIVLVSLIIIWLVIGLWNTQGKAWRCQNFDNSAILPLRGILAVMIVLHHFPVFYPIAFSWMNVADGWGGAICSLFFFFSGYGLVKSYLFKGNAYLKHFFSKRLSKIVIPACVVICFHLVALQFYIKGNFLSFILGFKNILEILPHYWFILTLFLFYLVFYLAFKCKNEYFALFLICITSIIYYYFTKDILKYTENWWNSIHGFAMGAVIAKIEPFCVPFLNRYKGQYTLLMGTFIASICIYCLVGCYIYHLPGWGTIFFFFLPIIVYVCNSFVNVTSFGVFQRLGLISLEIYLVHISVMRFFHTMRLEPIIDLLFVLLLTISFALLLQKSIKVVLR